MSGMKKETEVVMVLATLITTGTVETFLSPVVGVLDFLDVKEFPLVTLLATRSLSC
jgi:hypothetical protein